MTYLTKRCFEIGKWWCFSSIEHSDCSASVADIFEEYKELFSPLLDSIANPRQKVNVGASLKKCVKTYTSTAEPVDVQNIRSNLRLITDVFSSESINAFKRLGETVLLNVDKNNQSQLQSSYVTALFKELLKSFVN